MNWVVRYALLAGPLLSTLNSSVDSVAAEPVRAGDPQVQAGHRTADPGDQTYPGSPPESPT